MRKLSYMKYLTLLIALTVAAGSLMAQEDNNTLEEQTVVIYNEYSPVLKDASRIQSLPVIEDTVKVEPKFEYSVMPTMYRTSFTPSKIPAATVKGEALKPLNTGLVKIGYGNYISPFAELYINSKRQKNYSLGIAAQHHSSFGKIKNYIDQKIYSGYDDSNIEAFGKKIFAKSVLSGKIYFSSNGINYYGYDPKVYGDPYTINWDSIDYVDTRDEMEKQRFNRLGANMTFESQQTGRKHWNYKFDLGYQYFFTKTKDWQHKIGVDANVGRSVKNISYGVDINYLFNANKMAAYPNPNVVIGTNGFGKPVKMSSLNDMYLNAKPYFRFENEKWQIRAGANFCFELLNSENTFYIYPDVYAQLNVSNTIIPYVSYGGHLQTNNLEFISTVNPFINSYESYHNTSYQHEANLGVKAIISKKVYLHLNANYSHINNMVFFVNDTTVPLHNKFVMEYMDVDRVGAYAELSMRELAPGLDIMLKAHYYYYIKLGDPTVLNSPKIADARPWQMPDLDVSLRAAYRLTNKISFGVEGYFLNRCFAKEYNEGVQYAKKMKAVIDVNLFGEYKFDDNFSAFLYLNNIACQRYYIWNNYRAQGFNALVGLTYVF
ncbi:MAG: TonB-dependent receptor [Bacteroidales bacterium]|nr:TonB-dependent receptor [Bacteroidales bacterium]